MRELRTARPLVSAWLVGSLLFTGSCERGQVVKFSGCAIGDERLSVAVRTPKKAVSYLGRLEERLKANEPGAAEDAADLVHRLRSCIES